MDRSRGKILVVRGGAIGDFILTLPVLAALRQQFPEAGLEVLGYPHIAQLAVAGGLADEIRSIDARPLAGFFARDGSLDPGLQSYFGGFAIVISYLYDPDLIFQNNVRRCSRAQFIAGPHRPEDAAGVHATEFFLKPLERLAIFNADPIPRLNLVPSPPAHADRPMGRGLQAPPMIALHPGSGSERKNWPESNWAGLIQRLMEKDWRLLLVGGEAEADRLVSLAAVPGGDRIEVALSRPLVELARQIRGCRAFLGHDSGISHLAAAVGVPAIVLWGQTVEAVWRPRSERVTIVKPAEGLAHLSVERVLAECESIFDAA